jgi:5'-3' exonuclease/transcription antitermination factor NusG
LKAAGLEEVLVTTEWVVLELNPQGEDEDPDVLHKSINRMVKGKEFFIPASVVKVPGGSRVVHKLIDNYVFVKRELTDADFLKMEGTRYVASVLTVTSSTSRRLACVYDRDIDRMRRQIHIETEQGIEVGDDVVIMSEPYKNLRGRVIEDIPETGSVQVFINLRSKKSLLTLPRTSLRYIPRSGDDEQYFHSPFITKVTRIRDWTRKIAPLVSCTTPNIQPVVQKYNNIVQIDDWRTRGRRLLRLITDTASPSKMITDENGISLAEKYARYQQIRSFIDRGNGLFHKYRITLETGGLTPLENKELQLAYFQTVFDRLQKIQEGIEDIERSIPDWEPSMVQNLIFDGHNLAYRSEKALRFVQGGSLIDSEGRPTSIIFGFLRSVAALKKRFSQANIYVVWDGSRQRRVKDYPDYKATREPHADGVHEEMLRLRSMLPLFGVNQAYNPDEETDDLIAHLVKVKLKGSPNFIVSTDRDFLQLVTYTDLVLVPKVGSRPETLYDPDKVVLEYGVAPRKMIHLRAFIGDDSDNLPGVARIPRKVIASLLNNYDSLDGIYSSNLAGITTAQYEKIRSFEPQARLNLKLMALCEDVECPITEAAANYDAAINSLRECSIQPESIMGSFFPQHGPGFSKTG